MSRSERTTRRSGALATRIPTKGGTAQIEKRFRSKIDGEKWLKRQVPGESSSTIQPT
jgi:hypothetical protein